MRLYLVRHAKPEVDAGTCYGSSDLAVAPEENRRVLTSLLPVLPRGATVYSSPLIRCRELAALLAPAIGASVVRLDGRLAEMHFGGWEMRQWADIPRDEVDAWTADILDYRPGAGESVQQVASRVRGFYDDLQAQGVDSAIVVCHAGTIRLLRECPHTVCVSDMAVKAAATPHQIAYGQVVVIGDDA